MSLHDMFLLVKAEVEEAVAAVQSATTTAAAIAQAEIQEAVQAVVALEDALDYFGLVGSPIDALCDGFAEELLNLAFALDNRGYYAAYRRTFGARAKFVSAKQSYNGFTGGMGGESGGGGASGEWGEDGLLPQYPIYVCGNRNGAQKVSGICAAPPYPPANLFPLLGPCSGLFTATFEGYEYQYQYIARAVQLMFRETAGILYQYLDEDQHIQYDNGNTPGLAQLPDDYTWDTWSDPIGFYDYTEDETEFVEFRLAYNNTDWDPVNRNPGGHPWPFIGSLDGFLYGYPYQAIPVEIVNERTSNQHVKFVRDVTWQVEGKDVDGFWQYRLSYWLAIRIPYDSSIDTNPVLPDILQFINPCTEPMFPGKDIIPKPIPIPIPILTDEKARAKALETLRLVLELRPYEIMCAGKKIECDGQQVTCGEI